MTVQRFKRIALNARPGVNGWPAKTTDVSQAWFVCAVDVFRNDPLAVFCDFFKVLSETPSVHLAGLGQLKIQLNRTIEYLSKSTNRN